jgi:hypothetical protein
MSTLCKIKKRGLSKEAALIYKVVHDAEYICEKCLRSARKKKHLCQPVALKSLAR